MGGDAKLAKKYEARMAGTKAANGFSRPAGSGESESGARRTTRALVTARCTLHAVRRVFSSCCLFAGVSFLKKYRFFTPGALVAAGGS